MAVLVFSFFFFFFQHLELSPRGGVEGIRHSSNSSRVGLRVTALKSPVVRLVNLSIVVLFTPTY